MRPSAGPCVPCAVAVSPMCCGRASVRGAVSPVCCGRASVRGALLSELSAFLWCGHFRPWVPRGLFEKACVWLLLWLEPAVTHSRLVGVVPRCGKGVACTLGLLVGLCPWAVSALPHPLGEMRWLLGGHPSHRGAEAPESPPLRRRLSLWTNVTTVTAPAPPQPAGIFLPSSRGRNLPGRGARLRTVARGVSDSPALLLA